MNGYVWIVLISYLGKQYNCSDIPWDEIKEDPRSFYDQQQFDLPFSLTDPQTISGGKIVSMAEYFQEQGLAFRFNKSDQLIQSTQASAGPPHTPVASTSGSRVNVLPLLLLPLVFRPLFLLPVAL